MSLLVVHRPARVEPPAVAAEPLLVPPAPTLPGEGSGVGWATYLFPVLGGIGSVVFVAVNPSPVFILAGLIFALGSVGMGVGMFVQQRGGGRRRIVGQRRRYLQRLADIRDEAREIERLQRAAAARRHPEPRALWQLARDPTRVWERRPGDSDVLDVRIGTGDGPLARPLHVAPSGDNLTQDPDPVCQTALSGLQDAYTALPDLPVTVPLAATRVLSVVGDADQGRAMLRALVAQAVTWHEPEVLRVAVCAGADARRQWGWLKWLPHTEHPDAEDGAGPLRLVADDYGGLGRLLGAELDGRRRGPARPPGVGHLLIVVDGPPDPAAAGFLTPVPSGVTVAHLAPVRDAEPGEVTLRLTLDDRTLESAEHSRELTEIDLLSLADAEALARRLAPVRLSADSPERVLVDDIDVGRLLGLGDLGVLTPDVCWEPRPVFDELRVPIGVDSDGAPVLLDLKESALGGMGPHGLIVGATGSGKSELLRTLVTALVATHPPERLAMVLVDFKGGATFAGMAGLPHVAGMITNMEDDLTLVDRFHDSLSGEMDRRQALLRAAGNLSSIREYAERRAADPSLEPLPSLLVIVDEFSELLASKPDFIDMFVRIGRVGRSLGIHLLLASQRLDEGRLRGLESHLSYRIALRVLSAAESRGVIGVPDAYELPPVPGSAYLKVDVTGQTRLRVATVSAPYRPPGEHRAAQPKIVPFPAKSPQSASERVQPAFASETSLRHRSLMDVVVGRLRDAAPPVHQVWLSPLPPALPLDAVLDRLPADGRLSAVLGLIDRPREQRQDPLVLDLSGAGGHVAIVGGPRSGKSTVLRTLLASLALRCDPGAVQIYAVDLGGGLLSAMADLPHVGTVTGRLEPERVRRVLSEVATVLEHRETYFLGAGIDSVDTFRSRRAEGTLPDEEEFGDVVLVVDNWPALRSEFEDLEPIVLDIAARGLGYGVHLVVTANRWLDIRPNLRDNIGSRVELRLGEPGDSDVDRREAAKVPVGAPGRGLTTGSHHVQIALPRIDGRWSVDDLGAAIEELVAQIRDRWPGQQARPVRLLPTRLEIDELPAAGADLTAGVPIGIRESDLAPVYLDLAQTDDPHLLVFGDRESGKTNLLRAYLTGLTARYSPRQAKVMVVDYRRTLLDAVPEEWLLDYSGSAPAATQALAELRQALTTRLPGPEVTPAQLRKRNWWQGPDCYLVVDDYDLVASGSNSPLAGLLELLPQARDVGLHVILARRVAGYTRGSFEPVLSSLRELGSVGLILSGDPSEGPVIGGHRARLLVPGRGLLVRRHARPELVQTAFCPPPVG